VIDFRYHVVSIVAIFLALTVGLVIGASILSGSLANSLRNDLSKANNQILGQQTQIKSLDNQIDQQNKYIDDTASQLVSGRLSGQCVALVQLDGGDAGAYSAMRTLLQKQSGATVCSDTTINSALTEASAQDQLTTLLREHTPAGQSLAGTVPQRAVELLAAALTTYQSAQPSDSPSPTGGATPSGTPATGVGTVSGTPHTGATTGAPTSPSTPATMTSGEALKTLQDFQSAGMISMGSAPVVAQQATLAYVQAPPAAASDAENAVSLALIEALRKGGAGTVVGGSGTSADKGGLVYTIINDATATREISTVDDSDTTTGQVASVFCLSEQTQGSTATVAGHYGTGTDNDGPIPPIAADLG
jgi:Copper transport outer membrane protein, MctB